MLEIDAAEAPGPKCDLRIQQDGEEIPLDFRIGDGVGLQIAQLLTKAIGHHQSAARGQSSLRMASTAACALRDWVVRLW